jgi:hypothetical protein
VHRYLVAGTLLEYSDGFDLVEVVQRSELRTLAEEDPTLNEPWQPGAKLITTMAGGRDGKDIIQFLQSALFRFYWQR